MIKTCINIFFCIVFLFQSTAFAVKPRLVLLPVQGASLSQQDRKNYRIALQEGMSSRYVVISGPKVDEKLKIITSKTCDDNECLQKITTAFQCEFVGSLVVSPQENGYLLAIEIKDIVEDRSIEAKNIPCEDCNNFDVVRKLKQLGSGVENGLISVSTIPLVKDADIYVDGFKSGVVPGAIELKPGSHTVRVQSQDYIGEREITVVAGRQRVDLTLERIELPPSHEADDTGFHIPWWGWALGAVAIGAAVAGGGSGDSPPAPAQTGEVTVTW